MMGHRQVLAGNHHLYVGQAWSSHMANKVRSFLLQRTIWKRLMRTLRKKLWKSSRNLLVLLAQLTAAICHQLLTLAQDHIYKAEKFIIKSLLWHKAWVHNKMLAKCSLAISSLLNRWVFVNVTNIITEVQKISLIVRVVLPQLLELDPMLDQAPIALEPTVLILLVASMNLTTMITA